MLLVCCCGCVWQDIARATVAWTVWWRLWSGGSGGSGEGERGLFSPPNRQGMAPAARRFVIWSTTQFDKVVLSFWVSCLVWSCLHLQFVEQMPQR